MGSSQSLAILHSSKHISLTPLTFVFPSKRYFFCFSYHGVSWSWEGARIAGARKCALAFFCGRDYARPWLAVNCFCTIHTENRFSMSCRGFVAFAIVQHVVESLMSIRP